MTCFFLLSYSTRTQHFLARGIGVGAVCCFFSFEVRRLPRKFILYTPWALGFLLQGHWHQQPPAISTFQSATTPRVQHQLSHEKDPPTFHVTGIGILTIVHYNPYREQYNPLYALNNLFFSIPQQQLTSPVNDIIKIIADFFPIWKPTSFWFSRILRNAT